MKRLVFATNNAHKLEEIRQIIPEHYEVRSLNDIGCEADIPETGTTLEANAAQKSFYIYENYSINCFADDTGLEIEALHDEPGVYSARYAGEERSALANMKKVLMLMEHQSNRKARFRTVISLILEGVEHQFEGVVKGTISNHMTGSSGFGYDPIFVPDGYSRSFAEMSADEKNQVSHRGRAVEKLMHFLQTR